MYGDLLLALALFFSLCAMLGYVVAHGKKAVWGKRLTWLSAAFGVAASAYLMVLIFQNRFDIAYVAGYSSAELPTMYKISVFWAGQQGSFLLWLFIHMIAGLILCTRQRLANGGMALYLALQSALVVLVLAKSPFAPAAQAVTNGQGLNPLLQDPWMAVHPPIIFVGYALLAVPLVYALCALLKGEQSLDWLKPARNWLLVAWAFLGAGIFIGGYWAYKVLGWGGFWGWDPVENSSLVPWLLATVLLHVLHVARVRKAALSLVHLAAIFTYAFVLYGTFLTRSGILGDFSVHSFSGSSIGLTIAIVNGLVLMAGLIVLAVRANTLPKGEVYPAYASREFIVLLGMLVTVFITALVFLGMSMPLLTQLVGRPAAVDTAFYVRTTMPLAIVLMLTLACACLRRYGEGNVLSKGRLPAVLFVVGMAAAFAVGVRQVLPIILSGAALGAVGASAISWRQHGLGLGGMIAHAGVGLALMAMVFAGSGSQEVTQEMTPGEPVQLLGHEITYVGQEFDEDGKAKHYIYKVDGREVRALTKLHANGEDAAREPAIDKTLMGDVYLAPVPPKDSGRQEMTLKYGKMKMDDLFAYRFDDVKMEQQGGGKMLVTAEIAITDGQTVERYYPTILATMDGGTSQPIPIYDGKKRIRLTGIAENNSAARIEILPSVEEEAGQPITAHVSTKPFIWLLWLSSIMVVAGSLIAVKK
ncbi:MAG: cytochrome c biogenesis protein CcsA [Selenomonas sp.]|nr:cytochrome c biogenesis protein CcsA [Selenomonas sp.]